MKNYPTTSTYVTGLSPGTRHGFTINVKYNGLDGIEIMIIVSTRREGRCGLLVHVRTCVLCMISVTCTCTLFVLFTYEQC